MTDRSSLVALALAQAQEAYACEKYEAASQWLESVPEQQRPHGLAALLLDHRSRASAARRDWTSALREAIEANRLEATPARQGRIALLRHRRPMLADHAWDVMTKQIPRPSRLPTSHLFPTIHAVYACGAYYSRGRSADAPWSKYLRLGKGWNPDEDERQAVFDLAAAYLARFLAYETPVLEGITAVIPVPANPDRYAVRLSSLPDALAQGIEAYLAVPALPRAIVWRADMGHVEMKKLTRGERASVAPELFAPGRQAGRANGAVLLVDDLITSGSTMRACANVLLDGGVSAVVGVALAHTEG